MSSGAELSWHKTFLLSVKLQAIMLCCRLCVAPPLSECQVRGEQTSSSTGVMAGPTRAPPYLLSASNQVCLGHKGSCPLAHIQPSEAFFGWAVAGKICSKTKAPGSHQAPFVTVWLEFFFFHNV